MVGGAEGCEADLYNITDKSFRYAVLQSGSIEISVSVGFSLHLTVRVNISIGDYSPILKCIVCDNAVYEPFAGCPARELVGRPQPPS